MVRNDRLWVLSSCLTFSVDKQRRSSLLVGYLINPTVPTCGRINRPILAILPCLKSALSTKWKLILSYYMRSNLLARFCQYFFRLKFQCLFNTVSVDWKLKLHFAVSTVHLTLHPRAYQKVEAECKNISGTIIPTIQFFVLLRKIILTTCLYASALPYFACLRYLGFCFGGLNGGSVYFGLIKGQMLLPNCKT